MRKLFDLIFHHWFHREWESHAGGGGQGQGSGGRYNNSGGKYVRYVTLQYSVDKSKIGGIRWEG